MVYFRLGIISLLRIDEILALQYAHDMVHKIQVLLITNARGTYRGALIAQSAYLELLMQQWRRALALLSLVELLFEQLLL